MLSKLIVTTGALALFLWSFPYAWGADEQGGIRAPSIAPAGDPKSGSPDHAPQPGSKSDQNAKQEPTAKNPTAATSNTEGVLLNGSLNVPGASPDGDTVPAKYSAHNDADDKLATVQYTLKYLTDEQRRAAYDHIAKAGTITDRSVPYSVGAVLPITVPAAALPADVPYIARPENYRFVRADEKILVVAPNNRIVVDIFTR